MPADVGAVSAAAAHADARSAVRAGGYLLHAARSAAVPPAHHVRYGMSADVPRHLRCLAGWRHDVRANDAPAAVLRRGRVEQEQVCWVALVIAGAEGRADAGAVPVSGARTNRSPLVVISRRHANCEVRREE